MYEYQVLIYKSTDTNVCVSDSLTGFGKEGWRVISASPMGSNLIFTMEREVSKGLEIPESPIDKI